MAGSQDEIDLEQNADLTPNADVRKMALSGEFINLSDFMPLNNMPDSSELETVVSQSGSMYVRPRKSRRAIDSFMSWLSAWLNYEALLIAHKPTLYTSLVQYRSFMQSCDKKYLWHAVYAYDCRFRATLATNNSWEFHKSNTDIYITTFETTTVKRGLKQCFRCKSLEHSVQDCPFPAPSSLEENAKKTNTSFTRREKWFHMGKEGWHSMEFHGIPPRCHRIPLKFHGNNITSMEFHGIPPL